MVIHKMARIRFFFKVNQFGFEACKSSGYKDSDKYCAFSSVADQSVFFVRIRIFEQQELQQITGTVMSFRIMTK
jgi:hypothetical protein